MRAPGVGTEQAGAPASASRHGVRPSCAADVLVAFFDAAKGSVGPEGGCLETLMRETPTSERCAAAPPPPEGHKGGSGRRASRGLCVGATHRALPRSTFPDDVLLVRGSLTSTIMGKVLACCTSPRRPQSASSTAEERQLLPRLPGAVA